MSRPRDPRQERLRTEYERLKTLNQESDFVQAEPVDVLPGSEPERYLVTFRCRGISGIDSADRPFYSYRHEVLMECDEDFPVEPPRLKWVTPIWHPNIQHNGSKGVCINKPEWLGGMGLDDLCRQMFEMVQYKNYHAEHEKPYPLDTKVAQWVLNYAEPKGIVDKRQKKYVDDKPFTKPTVATRIRLTAGAPPSSRLRIKPSGSRAVSQMRAQPQSAAAPETPPAGPPGRIKIVPRG